ncbi:MAG: alpha/beta hydrolase-fold protein [Polyangiaceae bacterium]
MAGFRRRTFIGRALAAGIAHMLPHLGSRAASAASGSSFEVKQLKVKGKHASRFDLVVPRTQRGNQPLRLLIALHGLGESGDPEDGAKAWVDRYGLGSALDRLSTPPVERTTKLAYFSDARLDEINAALKQAPFAGLAIACPFTPNFKKEPDRATAVREYGDWLVNDLLPLARKESGADTSAANTSIDGCSMGGPYALDTFLAHPSEFGAVGVVQPAFGAHRAPGYAERLADAASKNGALRIHLLSSSEDPFREATETLAKELSKRKVSHRLRVPQGPHDQPWLRETGTIEMVLFHEGR